MKLLLLVLSSRLSGEGQTLILGVRGFVWWGRVSEE
jgi:hypothetical protein